MSNKRNYSKEELVKLLSKYYGFDGRLYMAKHTLCQLGFKKMGKPGNWSLKIGENKRLHLKPANKGFNFHIDNHT